MDLDTAFRTVNVNQLKAATDYIENSLMILAAPGSGKTLTLTLRIAYLLNINKDPKSIFAVTFTKKAAAEMKKRLSSILPPHIDIDGITLGTFHHCALNILRANARKAGLNFDFRILTGKFQKKILEEALEEYLKLNKFEDLVNQKVKNLSEEQLNSIIDDIDNEDYRKSSSRLPPGSLAYLHSLICTVKLEKSLLKLMNRKFFQVFEDYNRRLRDNNAIDLPDILYLSINLLRKNPEVLEVYRNRYKYFIVDEFQDTNSSQLELIELIGQNSFVTVCGDDDQAIYGWRGATSEVFNEFKRLFPLSETIILNQNYRSTQSIVKSSQNLIGNNKSRDFKDLISMKSIGESPKIIIAENTRQEAIYISRLIKTYVSQGWDYKDIAILYRLHKIAYTLIPELEKQEIPIKTKSKQVLLDKTELGVIAYLRVIYNPQDEEAFNIIFNWPKRGLGDSSKLRLKNTASYKNLTLFNSLAYLATSQKGHSSKGYLELYTILTYFIQNLSQLSPFDIVSKIIKRYELKAEVIKLAEEHKENGKDSLGQFLQSINCCEQPNLVTLSSIHQAKGQEWEIVFVVRVNEGVMPAGDDIEEERRLAYVAATRAKSRLILTASMAGPKGETIIPSRFFDEFFEESTKNPQISTHSNKIPKFF